MNTYYGDYPLDATVRMTWGSYDGGTGASITQTGLAAADVIIFKDGSATQKTTTNGITVDNDFDSRTGLHLVSIDTSNDTGDAGFWVTGADYQVAIDAVTIDAQTVRFWVGSFSTENRSASKRLGAPAGASIAADIAVIEGQTDDIGVAGAGLTDLGGMSSGMKAEVNAEVDTAITTTTYAEQGQEAPPATASIEEKIGYIYKFLRNRLTVTATQISLYNDDATTVDHKSTISDNGTTFDRGEYVSGP